MDRDRQIWSAGASQMAREAAPHCLGTFSSVAVTAGLLGSVIKNVNVLLFAFNRVENGAHVHVHGVHTEVKYPLLRACSSSAAVTAAGLHTQARTHRTSSDPACLIK